MYCDEEEAPMKISSSTPEAVVLCGKRVPSPGLHCPGHKVYCNAQNIGINEPVKADDCLIEFMKQINTT